MVEGECPCNEDDDNEAMDEAKEAHPAANC